MVAAVNPKDIAGQAKVNLSVVPDSSVIYEALAMMDGAEKYEPFNWREKKVIASVYIAACKRHLAAWFNGEENASDSGVPHLGHAKACLGIVIDALEYGCLEDDRPKSKPGVVPAMLERFKTERLERKAYKDLARVEELAVARGHKQVFGLALGSAKKGEPVEVLVPAVGAGLPGTILKMTATADTYIADKLYLTAVGRTCKADWRGARKPKRRNRYVVYNESGKTHDWYFLLTRRNKVYLFDGSGENLGDCGWMFPEVLEKVSGGAWKYTTKADAERRVTRYWAYGTPYSEGYVALAPDGAVHVISDGSDNGPMAWKGAEHLLVQVATKGWKQLTAAEAAARNGGKLATLKR